MNNERHEQWLIDIENRVRFLENSQPYSHDKPEEELPNTHDEQDIWTQMELSAKQWDYLKQLKAMLIHLENKYNEHMDTSKGKGKYTYK